MSKISSNKRMKGKENFLVPVSLIGVLVPRSKPSDVGRESNFCLVTSNGVEYLILADPNWKEVLENYSWEEVRVRGLLNPSTMTVVPQWVLPHGPTGETQRATNGPFFKAGSLVAKIKKSVADLVLVSDYA